MSGVSITGLDPASTLTGSEIVPIVQSGTTVRTTVANLGPTGSFTQSGTGAVTTTVQSKLRETVSVKDFGAVGDGVTATGAGTDNTSAFQAAITAAGAGGAVYVPAGVYKLASQITIPSNFTFYGAGMYESIIFAPSTFSTATGLVYCNGAGGPPTTIRDMAVLSTVGGTVAGSVGINAAANGTFIRNVWCSGYTANIKLANSDVFLLDSASEYPNASGVGVQITSTDVTVSNCTIYNCYSGLVVSGVSYVDGTISINNVRSNACSYQGFVVDSSSNVQISNCSVGHNTNGAYTFAGFVIGNSTNVALSNCIARLGAASVAGIGIYCYSSSSNVTINGCQVTNFYDGIQISGGSGFVISGNQCKTNVRRGIYVTGSDQTVVTGNNCSNEGSTGTSDAGIYSDNTNGYALHNITGNICTQIGGGAQEYGIYANVTNNGAATGYTNITGNIARYNSTANIQTAGATTNIQQTGNY